MIINLSSWPVDELWKQLYWNSIYEFDDLLDTKELVPAIRHHPDVTDEIFLRLEELLAKTLEESIRRCSLPWIRFVLDEGTEISPFVVYETIYVPISDKERISIFQTFLERGWDINSLDDDGVPFINSVTHSDQLTHWFLHHGANPNISDPYTLDCALDRAAQYGSFSTIILLLQFGAQSTLGAALQLAVLRSEDDFTILPILDLLLDQNVHINAVSPDLDTALHAAVWRRSAPRAMLLLQRGADPRIQGIHVTQTPIEFARRLGDMTMVQLLDSPPHEAPGSPVKEPLSQRKPTVILEEELAMVSLESPLRADDWDMVDRIEVAMEEEETGIEMWVVPGLERPPDLPAGTDIAR